MSDSGRKDFSQRLAEKATPDENKTAGERVKENVTDAVDKVKGAVTPNTTKSLPQQAADKLDKES